MAWQACSSSSPPSGSPSPPPGGGSQRVAFDTATSGELAAVVLEDDAIRDEVVTLVADAAAGTLGVSPTELRARVDNIARTDAGADLVSDVDRRLARPPHRPPARAGADHRDRRSPRSSRDQRAAVLPPIVVPVEEVGVLSTIRTTLEWAVPDRRPRRRRRRSLLGLITHPHKADAVFGIGAFCIVAGLAAVRARVRRAGVRVPAARRLDLGRGDPGRRRALHAVRRGRRGDPRDRRGEP